VLPGYLERFWPRATVDVVEIDPGVTNAAFAAFGLDPNTRINTISLDARNYVDGLIEQQKRDLPTKRYDFIYEDALNDYSVPYQLTTKEFNDKLYRLLSDDGIYMVELIDTFDSGLFIGAFVSTLEQTFPFVAVISQNDVKRYDRSTYVVVAAKHKLNLTDVCKNFEVNRVAWYLSEPEIAQLRGKSNGITLTDDYAPVENMLAPVALRNVENRSAIIAEQAAKYASRGDLRKAMQKLEFLALTDPAFSIGRYGLVALVFADAGKTDEALHVLTSALDRFTDAQYREQMLPLRYNYAVFLKKTGKDRQAAEQLDTATKICNELLAENPQLVEPYRVLGNVFAENGDFQKAVEYFQKAVALQPDNPENYMNLIQALEVGGKRDSAIETAQKAVEFFRALRRTQDAENIKQYLDQLPH
jgi:Tfp pilus assembly protein PilF